MKRQAALLVVPAAFLAVAFFRPLAATLAAGDVDAWQWALTHPYVQRRVLRAVAMAALSVLLTLAVAVPLAWLHHDRRWRWSRFEMAVHAAPFVLPVFVVVFGIQAVFGAGGWTERALGVDILALVGPMGAVAIAHAYYNYGFAARLLHAALQRRPRRLEEAAQLLGASRWEAFRRTTLPLLAPSIGSVALLVFLFSFTSFGVVLYMGGETVATFETMLYDNLRGVVPQYDRAAVLGVMQLIANAALLLAYQVAIRRQVRLAPEARAMPPASPRRRRVAAALTLLGVLPAAAVLVGGFQVTGQWSLEPWRALLDTTHPAHLGGFSLPAALRLSLLYAAASASIAIVLTMLLAYGVRRLHPWARTIAEGVAALPLGTSSLLIGFGIVLSTSIAFVIDPARARLLIVAAHALVAFPFTARAMLPAIQQLDGRLDEAASVLGAGPMSVWWRVHVPTLRAPLAAALGLAVAMSLGDFGASLLLMSAENRGLSIWIDAHGGPASFNPLMRAQAVALSGLLMALAATAYVAVEASGRSLR